MFKESIFEGACATSTMEVLLIIAGSIGLGLLLGYLIWGWLRKRVNEQEQKIISLKRELSEQEDVIEELTSDNETLTENLKRSKHEFDLKSAQFASATTRIRSLEEKQLLEKPSEVTQIATKGEYKRLQKKIKSQDAEIENLKSSLKAAREVPAVEEKSPDVVDKIVDSSIVSSLAAVKQVEKEKVESNIADVSASKRGRGRPKKTVTESEEKTVPKRKRGRPKKVVSQTAETAAPKRGRGRPKKIVTESAEATVPKRKRGRPKKVVSETAETAAPKRGRGRPRKIVVDSKEPAAPKRGRGRPKKVVTESTEAIAPKRGRGRPKKAVTESIAAASPKRGRGRPKKVKSAETVTKTISKRGRPKGSKNKAKSFSGAGVVTQASQIFGKRIKQDDLTVIEGIGPKIAKLFKKNNLDSWEKVSKANIATLRETIEKVGPRHHIHDPSTWARQANMAKNGEWKKLKTYQDTLNRGRK